jgi:hypothetical protein
MMPRLESRFRHDDIGVMRARNDRCRTVLKKDTAPGNRGSKRRNDQSVSSRWRRLVPIVPAIGENHD